MCANGHNNDCFCRLADTTVLGDTKPFTFQYNFRGATKNRCYCPYKEIKAQTVCLMSSRSVNELTNACACVPFTGIPNSFPASTLLVPSKPGSKLIQAVSHQGNFVVRS